MEPIAVAVLVYDDAELLDLSSVTSTLTIAGEIGGGPPYAVTVLSPGGRPVTCPPGLTLGVHGALERHVAEVDTLVVVGGYGSWRASADPVIVGHVRRLARHARRVASVCTGAQVLAAAGLLDGHRATTHWRFAADLARDHPAVEVDPAPIFVRDGRMATSAGVTSALDLTLSFVAEDQGAASARRVARALVTYLQRPGTQAQMSMHVTAPAPPQGVVRVVVEHVAAHLDDDLTAATLARLAGVSERHLARRFRAELGCTPADHVRRARAEAAAAQLANTDVPLARVAARCGFRSTETMRTTFLDVYGRTPSEHRRSFRVAAPA